MTTAGTDIVTDIKFPEPFTEEQLRGVLRRSGNVPEGSAEAVAESLKSLRAYVLARVIKGLAPERLKVINHAFGLDRPEGYQESPEDARIVAGVVRRVNRDCEALMKVMDVILGTSSVVAGERLFDLKGEEGEGEVAVDAAVEGKEMEGEDDDRGWEGVDLNDSQDGVLRRWVGREYPRLKGAAECADSVVLLRKGATAKVFFDLAGEDREVLVSWTEVVGALGFSVGDADPEFTPVGSSGVVQLDDEEARAIAARWKIDADGEVGPGDVSLTVNNWNFDLKVKGRDIMPDAADLHGIIGRDVYEALGWKRREGGALEEVLEAVGRVDMDLLSVVRGEMSQNRKGGDRSKMYEKGCWYILDCRPAQGVRCFQFKDGTVVHGRV